MCAHCGCSTPETDHAHPHSPSHPHHHPHRTVSLEQDILAKNDRLARQNRAFFDERRIAAVNLMSSPGAGKTTLLERTLAELGSPCAVVEGDQATDRDAERIRSTGAPVVQINTGTGCHLDAHMVMHAAEELDPAAGSLLVIENVGNLVCPALFALGEHLRVVVLSVTEGDDKPEKYPHMFRASDVLLVNKIDLLPYVPFDLECCIERAKRVQPKLEILAVSALRGDGMAAWYEILRSLSSQRS